MTKEVTIVVVGVQKDLDGEDNKMEFTVEGTFAEKNGKYYLTYAENENTGLGEGSTTLKIDGEKVTMMRHGKTPSRLSFQKGERLPGSYVMPFGTLFMETVTHDLFLMKDKMKIVYSLFMDGEKCSENTLTVNWEERKTGQDE